MPENFTTLENNSTSERALALLSKGISPAVVAAACGVDPSRISQLLSNEEFANKVAEAKFINLEAHSAMDAKYDSIETKLLNKLDQLVPLLIKPNEVTRALQIINLAKRKNNSAPVLEGVGMQADLVNLMLPKQLVNTYTVNINNQVTNVSGKELLTIGTPKLKDMLAAKNTAKLSHDY